MDYACYIGLDPDSVAGSYDALEGMSARADTEDLVTYLSSDGVYLYVVLPDGALCIVGYRGTSAHVVIPCAINGRTVTALGPKSFSDHQEIVNLAMPDSIRTIGRFAFNKCSSMTHVTLSKSLTHIESSLFSHCRSLRSIEIPPLIERIENRTFSDCPLASIHLGKGMKSVSRAVFKDSFLERVSVDEGNPHLSTDGYALLTADGTKLIRILVPRGRYEVPRGCRFIGSKAFDSVPSLGEVVLPDTLERIGRFAFANSGLRSIVIPGSVETVDEKAFYYCEKLKNVTLHEGLLRIGEQAFAHSGVIAAVLPGSLKELGHRAFFKSHIVFDGSNRTFACSPENRSIACDGQGGLYYGETFVELLSGVKRYEVAPGTNTIAAHAFQWNEDIQEVILPEGILEIGESAFRGCRNLTRLHLPKTLEYIAEKAFLDTGLITLRLSANVSHIGKAALHAQGICSPITRPPLSGLEFDSANPHYYWESGVLCKREPQGRGDTALLFAGDHASVHIPAAVVHIDEYAFFAAQTIREIHIHKDVRTVGFNAFRTARPIKHVHIEYARPIDGWTEANLHIPAAEASCWTFMRALTLDKDGTFFNYDIYDSCVRHLSDSEDIARIVLNRLMQPIKLSDKKREMYEHMITLHDKRIIGYYAEQGETDAFETLADLGFITAETIDTIIEQVSLMEETKVTGYLLELKNRRFKMAAFDFSL